MQDKKIQQMERNQPTLHTVEAVYLQTILDRDMQDKDIMKFR